MNEREVLRERERGQRSPWWMEGWWSGCEEGHLSFPCKRLEHQSCTFKRIPPRLSLVFKCLSSVAGTGQMAAPANSAAEISSETG